jgi:hypothetical protein
VLLPAVVANSIALAHLTTKGWKTQEGFTMRPSHSCVAGKSFLSFHQKSGHLFQRISSFAKRVQLGESVVNQ